MSEGILGANLGNFIEILMGIVGLLLVAFAAYQVYELYVGQDVKNAQSLISSLDLKIDSLKEGQEGVFPVTGVEDWYLVSWSREEVGRPDKCFFESCLCICPEPNSESCQGSGFCEEVDIEEINVNSRLKADYGGSAFTGSYYNEFESTFDCIVLPSNLIELRASKSANRVNVFSDYGNFTDSDRDEKERANDIIFALGSCAENKISGERRQFYSSTR